MSEAAERPLGGEVVPIRPKVARKVKGRPRTRRAFGQIDPLPSGYYRARYVGPDQVRHSAPTTFEDRDTAAAWLRNERILTEDPETWEPPKARLAKVRKRQTFGEYAATYLEQRNIKPRTRDHYRSLFRRFLEPEFGDVALGQITPDAVKAWHAAYGTKTPTQRAHAYGLLRSILSEAERDQLIIRNPCHIRGAGNAKRKKVIKPATLEELETILTAMPARLRVMVLMAAWCAMRFGELTELRRKDVDLAAGVIHVRRGVVRAEIEASDGSRHVERLVGRPKAEESVRDIAIPPHLIPTIKAHLGEYTAAGQNSLLFPAQSGAHLSPSTLYGKRSKRDRAGNITREGWGFYEARSLAGRDDLRWHDLRHVGAVLAAQTGATLAELMGRLGHATPEAALRYQHASAARDQVIARGLSKLANPGST